ncbi:MAG: MFS transporter [Pseudobutyrivibrio sp.]|nr:MFS transporter [Pseudobutyrivibrio sp.]
MTTLLLMIIYLAFISLGLPDSLIGAGWPVMHQALDVPVSYMGLLTMLISGGTIVSSLLSDRLTRRFGTKIVTVVSVYLTAIALFGFSVSSQFWMLILFAIPYGFGAGSIDAALNNFVALHYTSRHMSWLHCFWGVGTVISPFVMKYALTTTNWDMGFRIVALIQFAIAFVILATLWVWKAKEDTFEQTLEPVGLTKALRIKGVPTLLLGFLAYCAAEGTAMAWASTYLVQFKGISPEDAAGLGSLFFIGITAGRFFSGFIMNKLGDRKIIIIGTGVLTIGIIMLALPINISVVAFGGFVLIGLGCAPIYPCIIHSTPYNFGPENSGAIIGIQMASAYVGTTFMPPLYGYLGSKLGFWIMPFYLLFFVILMITMVEITFKNCGNPKFTIRKTRPEDYETLLKIYQHARKIMKENGNPTQWGDHRPAHSLIENDIRLGQSYVLILDGKIRGVFALVLGEDPCYKVIEDGSWLNDESYGTIHRIASDGSASGIMEAALDFCQDIIQNIRIDTHADNKIMQHILEKNGFKRCGIIYVDDGTPRIAYQKMP